MKDLVAYLPWIGLAVGVFALFLRDQAHERKAWGRMLLVPVLVAALAGFGAFQFMGAIGAALVFLAIGALVSCLVTLLSSALGTSEHGSLLSAFGLTAFFVAAPTEPYVVDSIHRFGGLVCGLAVGALPSFANARSRVGVVLVSLFFVAGVVSLISRIGYRQELQQSSLLLVWSGLLAVGLLWGASRAFGSKSLVLGRTLAVVAIAGLSWLVLSRYLGEGDVALVAVVSVAAAFVTAWAVPLGGGSLATWGAAAVIWLGMATFAFSHAYGLGMATAGLVGVSTALVLGRRDLLPPIAVLVGLAAYRLFREQNETVVQAFDIGQHYAMIGFILGIVVLLAVADAMVRRRGTWGAGVASAIVALIAGAIVVGASAFFGPKGAIGLVVGLAVAPMVSQLTGARPPWTFAAAAALQSAVMVAYGPFAYDLSLDRDAKVRLLLWLAGGIIVLYALLYAVTQIRKEAVHVNA